MTTKRNLEQPGEMSQQEKDLLGPSVTDPELEKNADKLVQGMIANLERKRQAWLGRQGPTAKADMSHPYFWAAFIQSGDWRPMGRQAPAK